MQVQKDSFRVELWRDRERKRESNSAGSVVPHSFLSLCNHSIGVTPAQRPTQYLVLEHGSPKGPDCSKNKIELIKFLGTVWWGVFWSQQALQQVAQHLDHTLLRDGDDLFKPEQRDTLHHWIWASQGTPVSHSACKVNAVFRSILKRKVWGYVHLKCFTHFSTDCTDKNKAY